MFGTIVSLIFPDNSGTASIAFENVTPLVALELLTTTLPPCKTSVSVDLLKRNLTNLSESGSIFKFCTLAGIAVLPTAVKFNVAGCRDGSPTPLNEKTRNS